MVGAKDQKKVQVPSFEELPKILLEDKNYLELWEYFEERASSLKDKAWTFAGLILALNAVLVGYIFKDGEAILFVSGGFHFRAPLAAIILSTIGLVLCGFGWIVNNNYGDHIQKNWDRSDRLKYKINYLKEIIDPKDNKNEWKPKARKSLPKETYRIRGVYMVYVIVFLVIIIASIISLLIF